MAASLNNILAAIVRDIDKAAVTADLNRAHWQRIYNDNGLLRDASPNRIRLVEVNLSIPLAFDAVSQSQIKDYGLTESQVFSTLPTKLSRDRRTQLAKKIHTELVQEKKHFLLNQNFVRNVTDGISKAIPGIDPQKDIDLDTLEKIRQDFIAQPNEDREASFIYEARNLEKVDPEHIMRVNVTLGVE